MRPFDYQRAEGIDHAGQLIAAENAVAIAGGTNLLDLMKLQVETPQTLVDVNRIGHAEIEDSDDGGLWIGALATNTDTAVHPRVKADYPVLARAILAGATQQLRNRATTGGNLCQRTRCYYFTNIDQPCNKRDPGSGCGAIDGIARLHAVLGTSDQCIATYPGDMAVALSALDATVHITSAHGKARTVPVRDFHRLPGHTPWKDNVLEPGELITGVSLPAPVEGTQIYRKVRERSSYAFALCSIAAIVEMDGDKIARADLAFGGLAHKPWHDPEVGEVLVGQKPGAKLFDKAADVLLRDARGYGENDFKIPLARRTLAAVLAEATGAEL
ncbi:xanthine dehydrogenase family protein subunit M [Alteriqipengyuania sp. NZ-12B]|uniref:Xanthine dehydrogenase family protein subunit M n=1 Tax=Alteriqipengyuania abyssalis TaxID=2860200 RepID=A0ABS7PIC9_9SPHN|nr:xanthine dehydrogenase family protein subunit M [Alteriqipengyuania abyssalis]MBY8337597.1 xanthine dehydrogenase family protein subunit M [Alteriqipengyuania abyssalis]